MKPTDRIGTPTAEDLPTLWADRDQWKRRAETAEAERDQIRSLIGQTRDKWMAERETWMDELANLKARADKAESLLTNAEGAIDCPRCKTRAVVNNPCPECGHTAWNPPLLLQGIRATQEAAETLARQASEQKERADKAEAACAKMRYFIERYKGKLCQCNPIDGKCNLCFVSEHALSTDCGKGWISPEQAASLKCQWQMDCEQKARDICSKMGWLPPDKVKELEVMAQVATVAFKKEQVKVLRLVEVIEAKLEHPNWDFGVACGAKKALAAVKE